MIVAIFWLINLLVLNLSTLKAPILILRETVYLLGDLLWFPKVSFSKWYGLRRITIYLISFISRYEFIKNG